MVIFVYIVELLNSNQCKEYECVMEFLLIHFKVLISDPSRYEVTDRLTDLMSVGVITARKRSWGKVMFLQVSVILFTGGGTCSGGTCFRGRFLVPRGCLVWGSVWSRGVSAPGGVWSGGAPILPNNRLAHYFSGWHPLPI